MIVKRVLTILLVLFIVATTALLIYFSYLVKQKAGTSSVKKIYEVKEGVSGLTIAYELKDKNLIRSAPAFYVYARFKEKPMRAGAYLISEDMTIEEIAKKISSGDTAVRRVTIPEGYRLEQIARVLSEKKLANYDDFVAKAKKYEGRLFPDTYFLQIKSTPEEIIDAMLANYHDRTTGLTVTDEDLILASIVEREAKNDEERAKIAGVFKNRLAILMKLEADPTVLYANDTKLLASVGENIADFAFWQPIAFSEYLKINSLYNTYIKTGLPAGAICNPGIKSINASINPEKNDYLYFFHDSKGAIYLSKTLAEHDQKKALYLK